MISVSRKRREIFNNFGRGGEEGDAVLVDVQDIAVKDGPVAPSGPAQRNQNSMSADRRDGFAPRMNLQLFNGPVALGEQERDAALAAETILHEYTHGMNMRLIGHGTGLETRIHAIFGLDEGFADFFSFASLSQAGDNLAGTYPSGGYIARNWKFKPTSQVVSDNYYYGNLLFPNSTDMSKNPLTFKDLDPAQGSPHLGIDRSPAYPADLNSAEDKFLNIHVKAHQLWCVTLLEMRTNLIAAHGFANGNDLAMRLAVDSMKLCPPNPNFLQARDALLLADRVYQSGANQSLIWKAFAKRGMGAHALPGGVQPNGETTGIIENFALPPASGALWSYTTGYAISSSPAISPDGSIVFGSGDDKVYALNSNGSFKWSYSGAVGGWNFDSSPAVAPDGTIYIGGNDWRLYALNPDGSLKWVKYLSGTVFSSPAVARDGTVIVGVCHTSPNVVAFDSNGNQKWTATTSNYVYSSPVIGSDGYVYVGSLDNKVYAYAVSNGAPKPGWPCTTGGWVYGSPAIGGDGTVYVGSFDGKVYALSPDGSNGTPKWTSPSLGEIRSSPALAPDGTVYVGSSNTKVYALNAADGQVKQGWPFTTGYEVWSSPCVGLDGTVFVGSNDGKVYALNPDGSERWSFNTGGGVFSSVTLGRDGTAYVGSNNGKLYALPTGTVLARNSWPMFRQNGQHTGTTPETVTFVGRDQCTPLDELCERGNWQGAFGTLGRNIIGDTQNYPSYFQVIPSGTTYFWSWASSTTDISALQKASLPNDRIAACWYGPDSFSIDVALTHSAPHKVGMYFLDWLGSNQRVQRIDLYDPHSGFLLDSRVIWDFSNPAPGQDPSKFQGGAYLFWRMTGRVRFEFSRLGPVDASAVLSGIFLDP